MLKKFRITTDLFLIIGVTLVAIIGFLGYINSRYQARHFIQLKEESGHLTSEVIMHSLVSYMQDRDLENIESVTELLVTQQTGIERIRLINEDGEITVSSDKDETGKSLEKSSGVCKKCHVGATPIITLPKEELRSIETTVGRQKNLTVVTPIYNDVSCHTAPCHYHPSEQKVLGMIQTDYSLNGLEREISELRVKTFAAAAGAIALIFLIIWQFVIHFITHPVRRLLRGMRRVAAGDLAYRYPVTIENEIGHIGAVFNSMIDELETKAKELRTTRDHLEGIIESSGDIISTASHDGIIESVNTAGEKILGYDREELIGRKVEALFAHPEDREAALKRLDEGEGTVNYETLFRRKDGTPVEVISTMSHLREPDGRVRGTICISKDVTEYKELQKKLLQSERLAAAGIAVASLSHNAKNILNNLKGGSYIMRLGFSKEKIELLKEGWSVIELGISKLTSMAMDMLNFTREQKLDIKDVSLNDIAGEVCDLLVLSSEKSEVEITWELDPEIPTVKADEKVIHTAVLNMATNAVESCNFKEYDSDTKPRVHISTRLEKEDGYAAIEIKDNGGGIEDEFKNTIFKPFFSTKFDHGTGLGLAITAKDIKAHGGTIHVDSKPSEGAKFTIRLPLRK